METIPVHSVYESAEECRKSPCGEHHSTGAKTTTIGGKKFYLCDYCKAVMHEVPSLADLLRQGKD